jgi:cell division protease FtsH
MDDISGALGGRVAEELKFNEVTTGASTDLEHVTKMARAMVTRYGMSERLGPMIFGQKEELVFLGREIGEQRDYSEAVAQEIDAEVRKIIGEAHEHARRALMENMDKLEAVAQALLEVETLERDEFLRLLGEEPEKEEEEPAQPTPQARKPGPAQPSEDAPPALDMPPAPAPA